MTFQFGQAVLNFPASVLSCIEASGAAWRVLAWLASDCTLAQKTRQLAKLADCTLSEANEALSYWQANGVISLAAEADAAVPVMAEVRKAPAEPKTAAAKKLLQRADELPTYNSAELAALLEQREGMRAVVDEAQQIFGKIFNLSEVNILVGMLDYLGMSAEAVLLLLAHCRNLGKKSMRSVEKYAYSLVDRGITEPAALEEEFRIAEGLQSFEGEVRRLFGMKTRALTSRESEMLRAWVTFGYGIEIVRFAYELTIQATNEPSVPYTNSILERWHAEGHTTLAEIERAVEADKQKKTEKANKKESKTVVKKQPVSFDVDDFFEAALSRSFEDPSADPKP